MARRDDHHHHHHHHHHHQQQLHYASILPSKNGHSHTNYHDQDAVRRPSDQERTRPLYVDFENAFQDEPDNTDYFGFQPPDHSQPTANFHLQSVETISETENNNFSPYVRYQASRETSQSTTPSDTPPFQSRYSHRPNPPPQSSHFQDNHHPYHHNHRSTSPYDYRNLNRNFSTLNVNHSNENDDLPAPFTPDAIRLKLKQQESVPTASSQPKLILPQYFLVKYLGRSQCTQLWGAKAVRTPIDDMVRNARQISSMNEIPTLEVCVNYHGLTLTHRQSPPRTRHHPSRSRSPERHQHGLIPLDNISYVMHDIKYSKIASCIVLRQLKTLLNEHKPSNETVTECYAFLFQSKEHAHRFALALSEAFNAQNQPTRNSRSNHDDKREGRSPQRRSKHRHRTQTASKHNDKYLRDSHV